MALAYIYTQVSVVTLDWSASRDGMHGVTPSLPVSRKIIRVPTAIYQREGEAINFHTVIVTTPTFKRGQSKETATENNNKTIQISTN